MNYFQSYLPSLDEAIVAAWESQVAEAAEMPWLAEALAKSADLFSRFAAAYAQVRALPRSARRALQRRIARPGELAIPFEWQRKLARSLAGAALLLALSQGSAQAIDIFVNTTNPAVNSADGKCSLIEAILNANNDNQTASTDCPAGSGADTIRLKAHSKHTLTAAYGNYAGPTGLPLITSEITIEGNRAKIVRNNNGPEFRLIAVGTSGNLTLRKLTLSQGSLTDAYGGGIYIDQNGAVTIENSTVSGNSVASGAGIQSYARGGAIFVNDLGSLTIANSTVSGNTVASGAASVDGSTAYGGGIYISAGAVLTVTDSTITGNTAEGGGANDDSRAYGAGIYSFFGTVTITNSKISSNVAKGGSAGDLSVASGGGMHSYDGVVAIAGSTISGNTTLGGSAVRESRSFGGGAHIIFSNDVTITESTISKNVAMSEANSNGTLITGGGLYNDSHLILTKSTISGNTASAGDAANGMSLAYGGGLSVRPNVYMLNSTVSGNTVSSGQGIDSYAQGGGIFNAIKLYLYNSTIASNVAVSGPATNLSINSGGGIANGGAGALYFKHNIVSGNQASANPEIQNNNSIAADELNVLGVTGSAGVNFAYSGTDIVPGVGIKKIIGPLKLNGNPNKTKTRALVNNSPALDTVPVVDCPAEDQRGKPRPAGPLCDIGAFEKQ